MFETHSESEKRSFSKENHDFGVWILSFAEKVKNSVKVASRWLWTIFNFCSVTGMGGGIALGRNEKTPSFFWPGFEFKNYNWHPVLTGGQKTFLYQDFFRTLSLIWKTLPLPPQKLFCFNWQKGCSWTDGCHFSFRPPFSVKFSLKTFHSLVLWGLGLLCNFSSCWTYSNDCKEVLPLQLFSRLAITRAPAGLVPEFCENCILMKFTLWILHFCNHSV